MKLISNMLNIPSRLSPRERTLLSAAAIITFAMIAIYAVRMPGEAAARSASDRNQRAAIDLAQARSLTAETAAMSDGQRRLDKLVALATVHGLSVVETRIEGDEIIMRLQSVTATTALAWAAKASQEAAPLRNLAMTRDSPAAIAVEAAFVGGRP